MKIECEAAVCEVRSWVKEIVLVQGWRAFSRVIFTHTCGIIGMPLLVFCFEVSCVNYTDVTVLLFTI